MRYAQGMSNDEAKLHGGEGRAPIVVEARMPWPECREFKTIGLCLCPICGSSECWIHYLAWEKFRRIGINADQYGLVDIEWDDRAQLSRLQSHSSAICSHCSGIAGPICPALSGSEQCVPCEC